MSKITLRGITWDHSRALPALVASAQRWEETHPGVQIVWRKRTLDEFGHADVATLAGSFDLLVVDHPWHGFAARRALFHNLREHFEPAFLDDLAAHSTGSSFESYQRDGNLMALPIDAATPVASWREDRMPNGEVPTTWKDLIALARAGRVIMPGFPADVFLNLMMLVVSAGGRVCLSNEEWAGETEVVTALERFREFAVYLPKEVWEWNPIAIYEELCRDCGVTPKAAYCPFAYSYSNYGRVGFADHVLRFGPPVLLEPGRPLRSVLGGTGLAISRNCGDLEAARAYARFVADPLIQRTLYLQAGGQPADRRAWLDPLGNQLTNDFFSGTLEAMERAYVRPRYDGFVAFQGEGGRPVVDYLRHGGNPHAVHQTLNTLYRASRIA